MKEERAAGLVRKNVFRPPANKNGQKEIAKIIELKKKTPYAAANFSHYRELPTKSHHIEISYSSLYSILKAEKIHSPKTRKRLKAQGPQKEKAPF